MYFLHLFLCFVLYKKGIKENERGNSAERTFVEKGEFSEGNVRRGIFAEGNLRGEELS
jgi:hypothetical protein